MSSEASVKACKKRKGTKGGVQHEDFPGPSTFNFGVLMGSGALVLLWNRYSDGRIFRFSRCHPEASVKVVLVNSGSKYHVGEGVARLNCRWNKIRGGAGRGFVPHSLITAVFQRLSRIDGMGSDGIRCISAGMIAPISTCRMKCYKQSSMIPQQRGEAARRCIFTGVSEE
ncbi:hypothetical protein SADUNF_Sadunf17G0034400 [Salix dunnii]|uniref:Uncharacterized protein n=1 Tax=Salix dunnii TaxID=1413687 RepID=A0A835J2E9_9ROSI|nr:hypothetical protein SADUNF_Sadunf17G0034400 [Salix dunnii]